MKSLKNWLIAGLCVITAACSGALAQLVINPPVSDVHINGHTYTNAQLQANPSGWIGGIANDIGAVTSQYPTGRFNPRVPLQADLDFYVDAAAGNDARTCLVGNPCQTIQHTFDLIRDSYDLAGFVATVNLANGSYANNSLKLRGRIVGQQSSASLVLKGNSASPSSVVVSDLSTPTNFFERGDGTAIYLHYGAMLTVDGIRAIGGFRDMWANGGSELRLLNVELGNAGSTATHLAASGEGRVKVRGNYSVVGNSLRSTVLATDKGAVYLSDQTTPEINPVITFVGNPSVGITLEAQRMGMILSQSSQTTFVGTVVGQKFNLDGLALLWTNGSGGGGYIPGTIGGSSTNGSIFN